MDFQQLVAAEHRWLDEQERMRMESPTNEPFGTYWYDEPSVCLQVPSQPMSVPWETIARAWASRDSRQQAHFLNLMVSELDKACAAAHRTQMQACCIGGEKILEPRTVDVLDDIVDFFKSRSERR